MLNSKQIVFTSYGIIFSTLFYSYFFIIPIYLHITLYTLPLIILGAHNNLVVPLMNDEDNNDGAEQDEESGFLTKKDALLFPITGSAVLFSLYLSFKYADPWIINNLIKCFVLTFSVGAVSEFMLFIFQLLKFSSKYQYVFHIRLWPFASKEKPLKYTLTVLHIPSIIISTFVSITWLYTNHWLLHNIIAISITVQSITFMYGGHFNNLTILLIGLFFYDIFWVFGTHVMMSVASSIKAPVMFILPTSFTPWKQVILGLGDVVLPGALISMCLRFDLYLHYTHKHNSIKDETENKKDKAKINFENFKIFDLLEQNFKKFYFFVVLFFYQLGLITTGAIMFFFEHGQPALLYLVPYCLFSFYGSTILNGEFKNAMDYNDESYFNMFSEQSKTTKSKKKE